ncbi:phosphatidylserine decarboxylase family protein [Paraburkholderia sp. MMS20-SJTR3]|uniref:Phosphatidylserine decarboxylase family protein n=2 Tax=Paraburkholderia sejongensis TaxID=2886946 RepID=A0ABS8JZZ3_9BURK|nr:phosphatidylserine decarboxylase family protein [Paraburkholderia sp. MMS20-SJTR3]MCC8395482.1 phosphatidylserine decarboxylase family protein [Paraburkholderia sp. MMS20-SJTR3]
MTKDAAASPVTERQRLGGWLPSGEAHLARYRAELAKKARERAGTAPRTRAVEDLATLLDSDPVLRMDLTRAIGQARDAGYVLGYASIDELMTIVDYLMTYAPPFSESALIHCPLNAVLDWPMCMPSGYALFRDPALNAQLKHVLNCWSGFLSGPHSRTHLNTAPPDGWFSPQADRHIGLAQFVCDPDKPYWGFTSWNDFFTRRFRAGARPVEEPDNPKLIVSACESTPYNVEHGIELRDTFWIKSQPYSLQDMLTPRQHELARRFEGGSIYQAYLSAFNYHRWHAPVSGTIVRAYGVDGSYYSSADSEGEDPSGLNDSQGYITALAARAVIVIEADDPALGQLACVFVGMADVSSCMIEALPGQHVRKGDELGFFQYGGSTWCLLFEPGVTQRFVVEPPFENPPLLKVNAALASVTTAR